MCCMVKIACTQAWFARGQQNKSKASRGPGELAERAWHRIRECDFFCDAQRSRTAVGTTADSWMSKSHYMEPQTEFLPILSRRPSALLDDATSLCQEVGSSKLRAQGTWWPSGSPLEPAQSDMMCWSVSKFQNFMCRSWTTTQPGRILQASSSRQGFQWMMRLWGGWWTGKLATSDKN